MHLHMYAWHQYTHVGTVPDMLNISDRVPNIGHCFGHQSGLDESSRLNSTTFLHGIAFRIYLAFPEIRTNSTYDQILTKTAFSQNPKKNINNEKGLRQA